MGLGNLFIFLVCVFLGLLLQLSPGTGRRNRIVGGTPANISQFPYQLSLHVDGEFKCGAALISESWAITTGYCVRDTAVEKMSLRAGSALRGEGGVVSIVKKVVLHPQYDAIHTDYDIAAVQVQEAFPLGETIHPVLLPSQDETVEEGELGVVAGWGYTKFGVPGYTTDLLQVDVPIISNTECNTRYQNFGGVNDRMICAAYDTDGKDSCQGDNGGPLVIDGKAQGLVSWAIGCGRADYPHVYSRVAFFRNWIFNTTSI